MKKVLLTIIILSIAVTSVFGLVACNQDVPPTGNTQITDPNEFIKQFKETTEFTLYGFDDKGNEIGKISRNGNGEFMFIEGDDEAYVIKENNIFTLYTKTAGEWTKETDASKVEEMRNSFTQAELMAQLSEVGVLAKNDDGYWYGTTDNEKKAGFKMENGMFVGYIKINETWLKSSAIELKADIRLPEEAKDAIDNTQISDPNEFVKQLKTATDFTIYGYDDKGIVNYKVSINSNGEQMIIMDQVPYEFYLIKENNKFVIYIKDSGIWTKITDESVVEEMKKSYADINPTVLAEQLEKLGPLAKNEDGYWYTKSDIEKKMPYKMKKGVLVCYFAIDSPIISIKSSAIGLKADIELPEEAKNIGDNTQISDPNEFVKLMKNAKELTAYSYGREGNVDGKTIINSEGEIAIIGGPRERYIIKENDKFVAYIKEAGGWTKETDESVIEDMKKRYGMEALAEQLEGLGTLVNHDDGYWYTPGDTEYYFGVRIINGKWTTYARYDNEMIKSATVELKAEDIILPEEAKDAIDNTQINDPNEFVKQMNNAKELTIYYYSDNGEVLGKCSLNSKGEVVYIMDDEIQKECMYIVKENDKFVAYIKEAEVWTKETDELKIEEMKNKYTVEIFAKQLEQLGVFEKSINDYWYAEYDTGHCVPVKMEAGKLIGYKEIQNGVFIKVTTIELKADIILPEEAINATI